MVHSLRVGCPDNDGIATYVKLVGEGETAEMSDESIGIHFGDLPKSSQAEVWLSLPSTDHPSFRPWIMSTYRGWIYDKESDSWSSSALVTASLAAAVIVVAYFCGVFGSNRGLAIGAGIAGTTLTYCLVWLRVITTPKGSKEHELTVNALCPKHTDPQDVPLTFHFGMDDKARRIPVAIDAPSLNYTWPVTKGQRRIIKRAIERYESHRAAEAKKVETRTLTDGNELTRKRRTTSQGSQDSKPSTPTPSETNAGDEARAMDLTSNRLAHSGVGLPPVSSIGKHWAKIVDAKAITESMDVYDTSMDCRHAEQVATIHRQAAEALKVYNHLPERAVHLQLASGKTPTEELNETLAVLAGEASHLADQATHEHADKLSFMRRYSTDKYRSSDLDH